MSNNVHLRGFGSLKKKNPERLKELQSKGGKKISQDKDFMARIGKKGGKVKSKKKSNQ